MKRTWIVATAALIAAGVLYASIPPSAQRLAGSPAGARGVMHVHTRRSDGSGTPAQIAGAAAKAGLQFVILTDHGDGTRTPLRPAYHGGVLVLDAVEVSAEGGGHVIALGLPKTPYPFGGEARDIIEDVSRLGGMSIAAHPASTKQELRWTDWTSPFSGFEWLNADSESRGERWTQLARVLFTYPFRPSASLATLLDRPDGLLRRWDALTVRRRVVAVAGSDAHARFDMSSDEAGAPLATLSIPGYESVFRTFSITAAAVRLTRDPETDAAALLAALRGGNVYSSVDALAAPASVTFTASRAGRIFHAGDFVEPADGDLELEVTSNAPAGSRVVLLKDGAALTSGGTSLRHVVPAGPAVYRAEIQLPAAPGDPPVPWIVTNPIYVRAADAQPPSRAEASASASQYANGEARGWRIEKSARSQAALDVVRTTSGTELLMRWAIGGTPSESPYAAFAMPAGTLAGYDRLMFTGRADQPLRLSVQFRVANGERWRRSVFVDETARSLSVFLDDVRPVGATSQRRLPVEQVRDVLFVVDTVNTKPGSAGQFWIDEVQYAR